MDESDMIHFMIQPDPPPQRNGQSPMRIKRRELFRQSASSITAGGFLHLVSDHLQATPLDNSPPSFRFVHLTDMHVQPELGAVEGFKQCIEAVNRLSPKPDFVITGGDLIMDALAVDEPRMNLQWTLFDECMKGLELPVHHTIGNHDVVGWSKNQQIKPTHAQYGKRLFAERYGHGQTYRSFDHRGWHFILLDSIGQASDSPDYIGLIDDQQKDWLRRDLEATGKSKPIIIVTHIPFFSTWHQVVGSPQKALSAGALISNGFELRKLFEPYNIKLVLSGHGHVRERIDVNHVTHIQSGAVSGMWWKGPVFGDAEAFGVVTCHADRFDYQYETFGWKARKA